MHLSQLTTDFDWLPVVACTGLAFGPGALWYSRVLFGKVWMQEVGLTEEAVGDANMGLIFGGTIVLQLLVVTALSALLGPGSDWLTGLQTGLWIGLFWIATAYGITYLVTTGWLDVPESAVIMRRLRRGASERR